VVPPAMYAPPSASAAIALTPKSSFVPPKRSSTPAPDR
jgi:hypothetical protein